MHALDDVTLREMETNAMLAAVERGQADIAAVSEPLIRQGISQGLWREPFYGAPAGIGPYLYTSLSVNGRSLREEPEIVVAVLRGLIRGFQALHAGGVEGALAVAQTEFPTMGPEDLRATLTRSFQDQLWAFDGPVAAPSEVAFNTMVDVGLLAGTFKVRVPYEEVVEPAPVERAHATLGR